MTMLTAAEVAQKMAISQRMVYELAARGDLPAYRIGSAVRFESADVEAFRASCRSTGKNPSNAGVSTIKARSPDGESALESYFRKAGRRRKPKSTSARSSNASLRLATVND